jgi:cold shock CspA family protein
MNQSETQVSVNENTVSINEPNLNETNLKESFESRVENVVYEQQINADVFTGQVKWFNNRLGYGFITIITPGKHLNEDVFVHQQHITPKISEYRSLQQGEYVSFKLGLADSDVELSKNDHQHQAISVRGVYGGSLLCDQIARREPSSNLNGRSNNRLGNYQNTNTTREHTSRENTSKENTSKENTVFNQKSSRKPNNEDWQKVRQRKQY